MKLYLVGGAVRNNVLGWSTGDLDFAVEAGSYEEMRDALVARGLHIWQERPEFVTVRGQMNLSSLGEFGGLLVIPGFAREHVLTDSDFTLCREETQYSDRRHPDSVTPTTIEGDLARRDFTMNAIAVAEDGQWIDPHNGREHLHHRMLRCVGIARERFEEDPLRMLRAVRFAVRYSLWMASDVVEALDRPELVELLGTLPHERVREELNKALTSDWRETMLNLMVRCPRLGEAVHRLHPNLWLKATTEEK